MIENYEDAVNQTDPARQADTTQFRYFGGMLLQMGGELGFHGYNHQPLALWDTDYGTLYVYKTWKNKRRRSSHRSTNLLPSRTRCCPTRTARFTCHRRISFPARARKLIGTDVPRALRLLPVRILRTAPTCRTCRSLAWRAMALWSSRVLFRAAWSTIPYMRLAAASELNMHYVSTHFMHPDDLLWIRIAAPKEGWESTKGGLTDYLDWLTKSAPDLRHQTASECSGAIQRFFVRDGERGYQRGCLDAQPGQFPRRGVAHVSRQQRRAGCGDGWRDYASDGRPGYRSRPRTRP